MCDNENSLDRLLGRFKQSNTELLILPPNSSVLAYWFMTWLERLTRTLPANCRKRHQWPNLNQPRWPNTSVLRACKCSGRPATRPSTTWSVICAPTSSLLCSQEQVKFSVKSLQRSTIFDRSTAVQIPN